MHASRRISTEEAGVHVYRCCTAHKYAKTDHCRVTHYVVRLQATARRLVSAAPILRTREQNQNVFTVERIGVKRWGIEICSTVAVTAEKNVATVARFKILSESRLCSYCIAGIPVSP
jgi:hypothetical protein